MNQAEKLLCILGMAVTFSGFSNYLSTIVLADQIDMEHIYDISISTDEHGEPREKMVYRGIFISILSMFVANLLITVYEHNILHHSGIITYDMYHNRFVEIAEKYKMAEEKSSEKHEIFTWKSLFEKLKEGKFKLGIRRGKKRSKKGDGLILRNISRRTENDRTQAKEEVDDNVSVFSETEDDYDQSTQDPDQRKKTGSTKIKANDVIEAKAAEPITPMDEDDDDDDVFQVSYLSSSQSSDISISVLDDFVVVEGEKIPIELVE